MSESQNEISLKAFLVSMKAWFSFFLSKWILIMLVSAIFAGLGVLYAYLAKPKYTSSTSFVLIGNSGSSGGILGLASQFGIDLGGMSNDAFSGDNIIELIKSRNMVQQALLQKPDNKETLLNLIVKQTKTDIAWSKLDRTKGAYPFPDDKSKMTLIQDSLFRSIYISIVEGMLQVFKPDKEQSIYQVTTVSTNENFAYYLTKYLVDVTSSFYIETKTKMAKQSLTMLQHEADSLRNLLAGTITESALQNDLTYNLNPAYQVHRSGAQQSQLRASALGEAYGEVLKSLEIAKINLQQETPLFQIIDEPVLPLIQEKPSKLISLILGGFLGAFLIMSYLIIRKLFNNSLPKEETK